jgi:preprotein translocase subunit SecB
MNNYKIIAKYIKNLNFKIPDSKAFFLLSKNISNYKIKIDIKSHQFKETIIEVEITLALNPAKKMEQEIETKIIYCAIIELSAAINDKKELEEIILIKVPNDVYSDIRNTFVHLFEKSGFKDIKIDQEVNFEKLYNLKKIQ